MEILADGSCREVGEPRLVLDDARGGRFFVAGTFGAVQWFGWGGAAGYRHQVAVYNREDASCLLVVPTRWQVTSLALHPSGAYLAVGAGEYDGGLDFDGELLLIDLGSGQATSLLRRSRAVASLEWTSDESLRVTVLPVDDGLGEWSDLVSEVYEVVVNWAAPSAHGVELAELEWQAGPFRYPEYDLVSASAAVAEFVALAGRQWVPRRSVWALHNVGDGTLLEPPRCVRRLGLLTPQLAAAGCC